MKINGTEFRLNDIDWRYALALILGVVILITIFIETYKEETQRALKTDGLPKGVVVRCVEGYKRLEAYGDYTQIMPPTACKERP